MQQNTVIIVCGPTAVGKTAFAIDLALTLQTEIISADSRQCFKELNVGVAKPAQVELVKVCHYFVNSHTITEEVNAAVFEQYALEAAEKIFHKSRVAVVCGGTGLYIKAFCDGLDAIPEVPPAIRQQVIEQYRQYGLDYLQEELKRKDPSYNQLIELQNPQRLMRALEVVLSTGRSITAFKTGSTGQRPFNIIKTGLELPRDILYERINTRVNMMIANSLVDEAQSLIPFRHLNALQTVGYRELFDYFEGKFSLEKAIETIKTNTRHYAKRQITWFKKDKDIRWFSAGEDRQSVIEKISQSVNQ